MPIVVTEPGISIDVKPEQLLKASSPIVITLSVRASLFNDPLMLKRYAILSGTVVHPNVKSLTGQSKNKSRP